MVDLEKLILLITGMPGAGKTTLAEILSKKGFVKISMGDVVREEAVKRGYGLDDKGQSKTMRILREEEGPDAIAKLCIEKIKKIDKEKFVIDGVRSLAEVSRFKTVGSVKILAVHASPKRRFSLLTKRGREDDPKKWEEFERRDERELQLGLGNVIALADYMVVNEKISIKELEEVVVKVLEDLQRND